MASKRVFSNFGPRRVAAPRTPDRMAAAAAVVVAQRKRHAAAELAAEEHEAQGGTPRAAMLSPKKVPKKPKKVETKPPLPYQQQVFDFYQNEKIQIFVAVRGLVHLDTIAPLAVRQGSAPLSQAHPLAGP